MFAIVFGAFIGFESTAIYAEEARDPEKTVPRAIYLAVGFLGIFYTFMAWIIFTAYGKSANCRRRNRRSGRLWSSPRLEHYVGHPAMVVTEVLLVTSAFASALAFHNTAIRYLHALGRERILPEATARVHPVHRSPYRANIVQTVFSLLVIGGIHNRRDQGRLSWGVPTGGVRRCSGGDRSPDRLFGFDSGVLQHSAQRPRAVDGAR